LVRSFPSSFLILSIIEPVVEAISMIHSIVLAAPIPTARSVRPVGFAEAEHVPQPLAGIFLIELLAVVRGAGVPAVAAQRIVLAGYAQFVHGAIHRVQ
jgi:hypothetical protein